MNRTLTEEIARGRRAIAIGQDRGMNTAQWEQALADLQRQELLAWASEVGQGDEVLPTSITYQEAPLRPVTTNYISRQARMYLRDIALAEVYQQSGGWGRFDQEWWASRAAEAIQALEALRAAVANSVQPGTSE